MSVETWIQDMQYCFKAGNYQIYDCNITAWFLLEGVLCIILFVGLFVYLKWLKLKTIPL